MSRFFWEGIIRILEMVYGLLAVPVMYVVLGFVVATIVGGLPSYFLLAGLALIIMMFAMFLFLAGIKTMYYGNMSLLDRRKK